MECGRQYMLCCIGPVCTPVHTGMRYSIRSVVRHAYKYRTVMIYVLLASITVGTDHCLEVNAFEQLCALKHGR